jgi:protease-4
VSLRIDQPFLKHLFEKIGIEPEFGKRKDYKTAVDTFLEDKMTDANKEMTKELMDSIDKQIKAGIAAKRGLTFEKVQKLVETGPFVSEAALEAKLVDGVCYRDELYEKVLPTEFGFKDKKEMNLLFFERYMPKVQHLRPYLSVYQVIKLIFPGQTPNRRYLC